MVNKVTLLGRVGKDVEMRTTTNGTQVATFTMATSEKYNGEEKTEWHKVVAFSKTAEIASKYVNKGDMLYVEGKIQYRTWEKPDGTKGYATDIVALRLVLLGNKKKESAADDYINDEEPPF